MFVLGCEAVPVAVAQRSDINKILNRFPGYHVLTLRERDSETRDFIRQHNSISPPAER